jgi:membrane protease YdiL (CAAX protease family)
MTYGPLISKFCLETLVALGFFVVAASALSGTPPTAAPEVATAVLVAALAEEVVFRVALPAELARVLDGPGARISHGRFVAIVLAQAAFAMSHVVTAGRLVAPSVQGPMGLFTAGVLYSIVVAAYGVGLAAGTHATLNFTLMSSESRQGVGLPQTALIALAGLYVLWTRHSRAPVHPNAGAETPSLTTEEAV